MPSTVCIVGGGPAGIMLGFLLARAGVPVTVLEKHKDFFRDFRGDTIHPSTLELLYELGLLDKLLAVPHSRIDRLSLNIGGETFILPDFTHLPTHAKFIALMPQWDFLDFLSAEAKKFPTFDLRMNWSVTGLLETAGPHGTVVTGVRADTPDGPVELPATLTVGCDGRHATSVASAHLHIVEDGVPVDVLWFRLARQDSDPADALGYIDSGRVMILINRNSYYQCAYIIAKGTFPEVQQRGLARFHADIEATAPFLKGRAAEVDSWDKVKLLTVQLNHLERWAVPGLLCIGDAAHAMSPVGGIGINIALQDAVAAAHRLIPSLLDNAPNNGPTVHDLLSIQHYREGAVRNTQRFQAFAHGLLDKLLRNPSPIKPPPALRILTRIPGFHRLAGRFIGLGLQPQHIRQPASEP